MKIQAGISAYRSGWFPICSEQSSLQIAETLSIPVGSNANCFLYALKKLCEFFMEA